MFGKRKIEETIVSAGKIEYIIAGLGNPGREYEGTRHNAGFISVDALAQKCGASIDRIKFKSLCADAVIAGHRALLLKPQTFMNSSGEAIRDAAGFYKIPMERVIILYDDISLAPGKIRVRPKGTDGGHNGIKSIIYLSGTDVFPRVKVGVGAKPRPDYDLAAWVLGKPSKEDAELITNAVSRAVSAVETIITDGAAKAMNDFN
ncbi:MAG TPA: aminoacyl-tRNA hydrolase [Ruminiclostridium sp.]|nr:aminoacyl-tRNA hydrolase [Ruminiclostridium sp.]